MQTTQPPAGLALLQDAFSWRPGMTLKIAGALCKVLEIRDRTKGETPVLLENLRTGEKKLTTIESLNVLVTRAEAYPVEMHPDETLLDTLVRSEAERKIIKDLPLGGASRATLSALAEKARWLTALRKHDWMGDLEHLTMLDIAHIGKVQNLVPRDRRTLITWAAQESSGTLIPNFPQRGGPGKPRVHREAHDIVMGVIQDIRLGVVQERPLPKAVHALATTRIVKVNAEGLTAAAVQMVSVSTVQRTLDKTLSPYEKVLYAKGDRAAKDFARATGARPLVDAPGAIVECDDTDSKTFCISRKTGLAWGRPWITYGIDQSEFPMGRSLGPRSRSATSALDCVVNCIEAKAPFVGFGGVQLTWESVGYPAMFIFDNALYNNSRILNLNSNADKGWARPYQPLDKRNVEYVNGRTAQWVKKLPGFRGARNDPEALKEGLGTALMTFEEFDLRHVTWLLGEFANEPMGKTGLTRRQLFMEHGRLAMRPKYPPDVRRLRFLRMVPLADLMTWTSGGIRYLKLTYQNEEQFRRLVTTPGGSMKVPVRIDITMEYIYVTMPGGNVVQLRCLQWEYAEGLTHYAHSIILKKACAEGRKNLQFSDLLKTREALSVQTQQQARSGKVRERKAAERTGDIPKMKDASPRKEAVHDLQVAYEQFELVTLDTNDEDYVLAADI